jgi:hypothetical protein
MSIRLRFTITLTALGLILLGGYAILAYQNEQDDLQIATEREVRTLGRSLATSLGNALRDKQRADVDETLQVFETLEPVVHVHVHDVDGHDIAHSAGAPGDDEIERLVRRPPPRRPNRSGSTTRRAAWSTPRRSPPMTAR